MNRNWTPQEVISKNCRDCHKRIYLDVMKHKFFNDPQLEDFHNCEKYTPRVKNDISGQVNQMSRQLISIESDIVMLRKAVHEIGQAVFEIRGKVA